MLYIVITILYHLTYTIIVVDVIIIAAFVRLLIHPTWVFPILFYIQVSNYIIINYLFILIGHFLILFLMEQKTLQMDMLVT